MGENHRLDETCDFFTSHMIEEVALIRLRENLLFRAVDLRTRDVILNYLLRISKSDAVKVVVMVASQDVKGNEEYFSFYQHALASKSGRENIHRLHNVFSQIVLSIVDLNKIVIHVYRGTVTSLFLSLGLACDYRIAANNTVFQNPYLQLGLLPIGGGSFFLARRLGRSKALEVLLSDRDISAREALKIGIVDRVVAPEKVEKKALEAAVSFAKKPARSATGLKRLINYALKDLKSYMELENRQLVKIIGALSPK